MPARGPMDKSRGAYYTEKRVAHALCRWALAGGGRRLLDPAFGGGVFLAAALELTGRSRGAACETGGNARPHDDRGGLELFGVELHAPTHGLVRESWPERSGRERLINRDFFAVDAGELPSMDAVVGNPPFIRFQRFAGETRTLAAGRAAAAGVELSALAGSWAAFTVHSCSFLRTGGRLALVVPTEIGHARYARPLLRMLLHEFRRTTIVTFERPLFPHLDQQAALLLAEGWRCGPGSMHAIELSGPEVLTEGVPDAPAIDGDALAAGRSSLAFELLGDRAREIYLGLGCTAPRLHELATVESGYVTGANSAFHVAPDQAAEWNLPAGALQPAVFRSRALRGLSFGAEEWRQASARGAAGYLAQVHGHEDDPSVQRFLTRLEEQGVDRRYKARTRSPWYRIARVRRPALILAATGTERLRMAVNAFGAAVPNTFHAVSPTGVPRGIDGDRFLMGHASSPGMAAATLALRWLSTLSQLSVELVGHRLGGGMLKLDPGEAAGVLVPGWRVRREGLYERVEELLAGGEDEAAAHEVDRELLVEGAGIGRNEAEVLADALMRLRRRR